MTLRTTFPGLLAGDWLVLGIGLVAVTVLFASLWHPQQATRLRIRDHAGVVTTLSLNQERTLDVAGPLGMSRIHIHQGRVRFVSSPCRNQYCVHQGWLARAGQAALCLPNQVGLELMDSEKPYDSLNY